MVDEMMCGHGGEYMTCVRCRGQALVAPQEMREALGLNLITCHVYVREEGARSDLERSAIGHVRNTGKSAKIHAHEKGLDSMRRVRCNERCIVIDYVDLTPHPDDRRMLVK